MHTTISDKKPQHKVGCRRPTCPATIASFVSVTASYSDALKRQQQHSVKIDPAVQKNPTFYVVISEHTMLTSVVLTYCSTYSLNPFQHRGLTTHTTLLYEQM